VTFSVVILSGGRASRLGQDKASTTINGVTMIETVLRGIPDGVQIIVVGEYPEALTREVIITREEPAGSGPLSALSAGLSHVANDVVLLLATDMPFIGGLGVKLVNLLTGSDDGLDAVIPIDSEGNLQPLCAAYRTDSVRRACARIGDLTNGSLKRLTAELRFETYAAQDAWALSDVDTMRDLLEAREHASTIGGAEMMDEWIADVKTALEINIDVDVDLLLDVARDAAHSVTRPAAPITTYLLGIAVANGADIKIAAAKIQQLANSRIKSQGE
jgi:molybdopterin-guanine dinucleotide biosynthesis protein A